MGAMEREENIAEEETQYLLWKILKGIVSEGEKSFTEKEKKAVQRMGNEQRGINRVAFL